MNLLEAIKSGKKFKRRKWTRYTWVDIPHFEDVHGVPYQLLTEDILAEDYEVMKG